MRGARLPLVILCVLLAAVPAFLLSDYHLFQLTMVAAYAVAILGLNIVTGYNGQISLGHGAFYALGAYVTAILMANDDWPYWATLPVSAIASAVLGFAIGLPALRLSGLYLALTTFALAVATPQLLKYKALEAWTGGVQGIAITKPDPPFGLPLSPDQWLYLFSVGVAAIAFVIAVNLLNGRVGRAMLAIRDHATAAEAMGIDSAMVKTRSFALSAAFTGLAGSLGAIAVQFVAPDSFSYTLSIYLFVGMAVGGAASVSGAVLGAFFVEFVPDLAQHVSKAAPGAVYGVLLIACLCLMPAGVAGAVRRAWPQRLRHGARPALPAITEATKGGTAHAE